MPESTSTSKRHRATPTLLLAAGLLAALTTLGVWTREAFAADDKGKKEDKTNQPEDDDFSSTPFTEYAEFNEEADEAADTRYFQYGRFFGVSVGVGNQSTLGNRGLLWQGGFPMIELKVHYWFDFNVALDLGVSTTSHFYDLTSSGEHVDISFLRFGASVKYYFDIRNVSAAISFANPYVLVGFSSYTKTETSTLEETVEPDTGVGLSAGGGLEFAIKHRKLYFEMEGKMHFITFKDTFTKQFKTSAGLDDLTGPWFTATAALLFTW